MQEPKEAGFYWAKENETDPKYNMIVEVKGDGPWLYIRTLFHIEKQKVDENTCRPWMNMEWGPEIDCPVPQKESNCADCYLIKQSIL